MAKRWSVPRMFGISYLPFLVDFKYFIFHIYIVFCLLVTGCERLVAVTITPLVFFFPSCISISLCMNVWLVLFFSRLVMFSVYCVSVILTCGYRIVHKLYSKRIRMMPSYCLFSFK